MSEAEQLQELDEKLRQLSVEGLWSQASEADMATYSKDPHTTVLPHVWKWQDLYDAIQTVGNMHGLDGKDTIAHVVMARPLSGVLSLFPGARLVFALTMLGALGLAAATFMRARQITGARVRG